LKGAKPGAAGMGSDAPLRRMRCAYPAYGRHPIHHEFKRLAYGIAGD
jgi:hypothetical protein